MLLLHDFIILHNDIKIVIFNDTCFILSELIRNAECQLHNTYNQLLFFLCFIMM